MQDVRGKNSDWDLKVRIIDFKATTETVNDTLLGAEISLLSPRIQYERSTPDNALEAQRDGLKLIPNTSAVSVMTIEKNKEVFLPSFGESSKLRCIRGRFNYLLRVLKRKMLRNTHLH